MAVLFPDGFLHLGGDELEFRIQCWNISRINKWMSDRGFKAGDYYALQDFFVGKTQEISKSIGKLLVHWQELFTENMHLEKNSIVQVWKDHETLDSVVRTGFRGTLSFGWYLDHLDLSWQNMYSNEPSDGKLTPAEEARIIGGEACMWTEKVDECNIEPLIWPRTSAVAERLWSPKSVTDLKAAKVRLHDHVCRMKARGVLSGPIDPGFCY